MPEKPVEAVTLLSSFMLSSDPRTEKDRSVPQMCDIDKKKSIYTKWGGSLSKYAIFKS